MKMIPITQGCPAGDLDCAGWNDYKNMEGQEYENDDTFAAIANKRAYLLSKQFKINKLCYYGSTDEICEKIFNNYQRAVRSALIIHIYGSSFGIDINGFKGPNKWGRDQFYFDITNGYEENRYGIPPGTVVPFGSKLYADMYNSPLDYWRNNSYCTTENANKGNWQATYCAGRVLEEDAMNY